MDLLTIYNNIFLIPEGKRKSSFLKYFPYENEKEFKKKIDLLYKAYLDVNNDYSYDAEVYAATIKDTVSGYTSNKDTLLGVYKKYNKILEEYFGLEITISYPPIPISNTFERLMYIAKYLQRTDARISDLPDILWQSERTIENDLAKLRDCDGDPLQVCGKKFAIPEMDRSLGRITFGSTVHPFFLTSNLTQVITMLEGLREMCARPEYAGYALPMAREIWCQLSDYGKERIFYVADKLMNLDVNWYKSLDKKDEYSYHTERECSGFGDNVLMDCLKNSEKRNCVIEYGDDTNTEFLENVKVINLTDDGWRVSIDGEERILKHDRIIRSSYHKENMF